MTKGSNYSTTLLIGKNYNDNTVVQERYFQTFREVATMRYGDRGHYGYPDFPDKTNVGGAFYLEGVRTNRGLVQVGEIWRGNPNPLKENYRGSLGVDIPHTGAWSGTFLPDAWGADAFAKLKPTKPSFNALNSVFEMREVVTMLRDRFLDTGLRGVANAHLAYQFGWKPFLRDIRNMVDLQRKAQAKLAWLLRNNGKPIRTTTVLLDTSTVVEDNALALYSLLQPVLPTQFYRKVPTGRRLTFNRERVWASARFRFWLPPGPRDIVWNTRMLARLYGLNPSPSVIWNAIPWTWLIDWFTNVGAMLSNMDAGVADRLAADYMYVMRSKEWTLQQNATGYFVDKSGVPIDVHGSSTSTAFVKTRAQGDPFGFATQQSSLSDMQLSILGALGLSRLR